MRRRELLVAGAALPLVGQGLLAGEARAGLPVTSLSFDVLREGSRIGSHAITLRSEGRVVTTEIAIDLRVKFGPLTLYRYTHENRETWEDGRLVRLASRTDDNGEPFRVLATGSAHGLDVEGADGRVVLPADTLPTTYWDRRMVEVEQWLDTQNGRLIHAVVTQGPTESVEAGGRMVQADRFDIEGEVSMQLWYAGPVWVKLLFRAQADGSRIEYVLRSPLPETLA